MKLLPGYVLNVATIVIGAVVWVAINVGTPFNQSLRLDSAKMPKVEDSETGCQYLASGNGITPRLDSAGKPMCGKKDK